VKAMDRPIDIILSSLSKYRQTRPGCWLAQCPGPHHRRGDRNPSLSIREADDGTILFRCFVGCAAGEIVAALGLELRDLFPPPPEGLHHLKPKAPAIPWRDVFDALEQDLTVCSLAFLDIAAGKPFLPQDARYIAARAANMAVIVREVRCGR
jgi:hypothetical protein